MYQTGQWKYAGEKQQDAHVGDYYLIESIVRVECYNRGIDLEAMGEAMNQYRYAAQMALEENGGRKYWRVFIQSILEAAIILKY